MRLELVAATLYFKTSKLFQKEVLNIRKLSWLTVRLLLDGIPGINQENSKKLWLTENWWIKIAAALT